MRTHTHEACARARIYNKFIIYLSSTACENDTACHKRRTALQIKTVIKEIGE